MLQWPHMKAFGNWTHEFTHGEPLPLSCEFNSKKEKKKHMSCLLFWTKVIATVQYFCERAPLTLSKATLWFQGCLIIPSFPHTLHTYQHGSLFSVSTSETELRPQLHVLLHFPWQHDLTQGQLCFAAWIQTVTPQAVCLTSDWKAML